MTRLRTIAALLFALALPVRGAAQIRAQLPGSPVVDPTLAFPNQSPLLAPVPPPPGGAALGAPIFDPYGAGAAPGGWPSGAAGGAWGAPGAGPYYNNTTPYPAAPNSLFPGGGFPSGGFSGNFPGNSPGNFPGNTPDGPIVSTLRFFQAPRIRHTWLQGDGAAELETHDTDVSLVFAWPNFLQSTEPLYVVPSFSLHLWDGPQDPLGVVDLPPRAYSAFLDFGWQSNPQVPVGAELGARVGVFSDFNTLTSESLRIQGKGLLLLRMTPNVQLRAGAYYVDRNRIKLLPAGGILWTPNPQARFDISFPNPKLSQYMTTIGNTELWWYLAGEYGGGAWTVERASGASDSVDINDIRVIMGVEWGPSHFFRIGRRLAFVEGGWVTDRKLEFQSGDELGLKDTFMLRAGIGY